MTWILALTAWGLSGCALHYNGAFGFKNKDKQIVDEYQQQLAKRDLILKPQVIRGQPQLAYRQPMGNTITTPQQKMMPAGNIAYAAMPLSQQSPRAVHTGSPAPEYPGTSGVAHDSRDLAGARSHRPAASPNVYGQMPAGPGSRMVNRSTRNAHGSVRRVSFSNEGADFDPEMDETGQWLVFASTRHRETSDIYFKRIDSSAITQLTDDPANDVIPAISPNGKQIAFNSDRSGNWDIYLMDSTGGQAIQVTNDPAHEIHPSFSPDGKWLVYCRYGDQSGQWELVVIELANPSTKRFIGYGLFPNWSPVDNHIVFQRARERGTRWFSIWTVQMVDGQAMRPTEIAASANAAVITPDWSPDGSYVVFCTVMDNGSGGRIGPNNSFDKPQRADIWMVDAQGRNRMNLTQSQFTNLQPVWSSDGTIYFTSNRSLGEVENIWSLKPDRAMNVMAGARATAKNQATAQQTSSYPGYEKYPARTKPNPASATAAVGMK